MRIKKKHKTRNLTFAGIASLVVICCGMVFSIILGGEIVASPISANTEIPIPLEKIIQLTFSAAGAQTAAASSPTSPPLSTIAPTATLLVLPNTTLESTATLPALPPQSDIPLRFHFIDVGQGDSTLIQTPYGENILIDGGESETGVVQYLQSVGVQKIDLMVATHPHSDHIGGLVQVLRAFPVAKVLTSGEAHTTGTYENFIDGIASAQAEYIEGKRGDIIQINGLSLLVLNPLNNQYPDMNENSLVLQFTYGNTTFLLMGDGGADVESALLASGVPLRADILKVGHHASTSGSTPAFLGAVSPSVALYSAGIGNSYNHPAPQTITAITNAGAIIYGTDKNGTIILTVDSNGYQITTQKAGGLSSPLSTPTGQPVSASGVEIASVTSPVSPGAYATLTANTTPGASCSITVYYKSGPSKASGLEPRPADSNGSVSWTWKVGLKTTSGNWRIVVNCGGIIKETTFTVQ